MLCEVCPGQRAACFAFYRDAGPRLALLYSAREIRFLESKLLLFLAVAYEAYCQERALSWRAAVSFVDMVLAQAS